jgi:hypothetical protein|uniref:Uncharacterized protein n=1 Tax=Siphoviridae sp. ctksc2 TaxID=2825645 RepID=A0A8S5URY4_9CAUD|nr:MAG TPA: hypothetical protein [Siphoviridae sp. ctksc2]
MRIESLCPKRLKIEDVQRLADNLTTVKEVYEDAIATYGDKARSLLDRSGNNPIGAISLLMLAADQRKAQQTTEPTLSEQALAQTVRDQRDTIDMLKSQVNLYRDQRDTIDAINEQITGLRGVLRAVTASASGQARMYSYDLQVLPVGTVVRDESGRAWTCIDDEDGGTWATPTRDDSLSSNDLAEETTAWMAWVADK